MTLKKNKKNNFQSKDGVLFDNHRSYKYFLSSYKKLKKKRKNCTNLKQG